MNYGADAADQIVRYSMDGIEHSLRITGAVAKNLAVFIAAVLKDQKKTRGRTRMVRMIKDRKPMKFFTIPKDRHREFAQEAKARGLLYVMIRDKKHPELSEIMVYAEDAAKVNRVLDNMQLDYVKAESGQAVFENVQERAREDRSSVKKQTVELPEGSIEFEVEEGENVFDIGEIPDENFTRAQGKTNPSGNSLRSRNSFSGDRSESGENRSSVRKELKEIHQEQAEKRKKTAQKRKDRQKLQGNRKRKTKEKRR